MVAVGQKYGTHIFQFRLGAAERERLSAWIEAQDERVDRETLAKDWAFIENQIARQVAGLLWDRQALYRVWLEKDNQAQKALSLFGEARALAGV